MALLDFAKDRIGRHAPIPTRASAAHRQQGEWRRVALELAGTFLVLVGIAIGILTLRFALVLMHGMPH
jgi:hypothetical protein